MEKQALHVSIIGGVIGGLATAFALQHQGIEVTVLAMRLIPPLPTLVKELVRLWKMLSSWLIVWQVSANQEQPCVPTRDAVRSEALPSSSSPLYSARLVSGSSRCSAHYVMDSLRLPSRRFSPDCSSRM
jgi:hypothetical protein